MRVIPSNKNAPHDIPRKGELSFRQEREPGGSPDMKKQVSEEASGLGEFLKNVRKAQQHTLRDVEEATGVSNAYLSQLEQGKMTKPSPQILHKLASFYGVPYEKLME